METAEKKAVVYLVGAGPGDPGLMTVAGRDALARADVLVYDYLANPKFVDLVPVACEKIYVGKSAGRHTLTQDEINALLVEKAKLGVVVRLKGGDPYVFGRGGEEAEVLRAAGIEFVVIPGVTAGIAAAAYAGIPVTHRDFATTLTFVTGHEKDDADPSANRVDFKSLAALAKTGTLCFYMGVKSLPNIAANLSAGGLAADTPVAVIRWGTHPHQRTVTGTLATIADVVAKAGITAPAMTVVGKVVLLRETLNWFENRPLFGQTVLVTRTRQQASELSSQLAALGANVLEAPTIELVEPEDFSDVDAALGDIEKFDWIVFTSANGVRAAWKRIRALGFDARLFARKRIGAIGPPTAAALEQIGIVADVIPEKFVGEELALVLKKLMGKMPEEVSEAIAEALPINAAGKRFLLLRADIARPILREQLIAAGATVSNIAIYRTVRPAGLPEEVLAAIRDGAVNWITFTSASTAENLHALLPEDLRAKANTIKKISIGPITTAAMQKLNWPPTVEAERHDIPGMVAALRLAAK